VGRQLRLEPERGIILRLVNYSLNGERGIALRESGSLFPLQSDPNFPRDLRSILEQQVSKEAIAAARGISKALDSSLITFLPPIENPRKIIGIGLNYSDHRSEFSSEAKKLEFPEIFVRFPTSIVGHLQALKAPSVSRRFDYEGELAVVIGKRGRRIPSRRALEHVAGYSIFNDGSVRDFQLRTQQWTLGKNFDATGSFGPEFVTADELPPGGAGLMITTRLDGKVMQQAPTDDMIFDVPKLIEIISEAITLEPGDVIATGTPGGVGSARNPPVFMLPGSVIDVEIERIGTLRNTVVAEE
jgi:2-keto-4-pentenoate hydratase/2-oxohepta-3-ene-1,7-dioic acid hydratase in catechol pathway